MFFFRQKGDSTWLDVLRRLRTESVTPEDFKLLKSRISNHPATPHETHTHYTNQDAAEHNSQLFLSTPGPNHTIDALKPYPPGEYL